MSKKVTKLDSLAVVQVDLSIWSGQTKLHKEDLKLGDGGSLPSDKVVQLGSKKIIDSSRLKIFHAQRQGYRRELSKVGIPFMNGHAVPITKLDQVTQYLNNLEVEFNEEKIVFLNEYDQAVDQWALENPDLEEAIRSCALTRKQVEKRINFDYQVFKISPFQEGDERMNRKIEGLGDELIDDLINEAKTFYEKNIVGKDSLNSRTRSTLVGWYEKLEGLAFLSSNIMPLARLLKGAIGCYQHADGGHLLAPYFWQVVGAVAILSDSYKVDSYLDGKINPTMVGAQEEEQDKELRALHTNSMDQVSLQTPMLFDGQHTSNTSTVSSVIPENQDFKEQQSSELENALLSINDFFDQKIAEDSAITTDSIPQPLGVESEKVEHSIEMEPSLNDEPQLSVVVDSDKEDLLIETESIVEDVSQDALVESKSIKPLFDLSSKPLDQKTESIGWGFF